MTFARIVAQAESAAMSIATFYLQFLTGLLGRGPPNTFDIDLIKIALYFRMSTEDSNVSPTKRNDGSHADWY